MTSIDFPILLTTIFVIVDDWYQNYLHLNQVIKPGARARLTDSENAVHGVFVLFFLDIHHHRGCRNVKIK